MNPETPLDFYLETNSNIYSQSCNWTVLIMKDGGDRGRKGVA